jgi:hypothetical protein
MTARNTDADFWKRVDVSGGRDGCHPWTGRIKIHKTCRYGFYDHDGTYDYAHRYAWFLTYSKWPEPQANHTCDNGLCCNVRHMYEGTQQQNIIDRDARSRRRAPHGEASALARLTQDQVDEIRALYIKGSRTTGTVALGKRFGVDTSTIWNVVTGRTWNADNPA